MFVSRSHDYVFTGWIVCFHCGVNTTMVLVQNKKRIRYVSGCLLHDPISLGGGYAIGVGHVEFITDVHVLALCAVSTSLE